VLAGSVRQWSSFERKKFFWVRWGITEYTDFTGYCEWYGCVDAAEWSDFAGYGVSFCGWVLTT